MYSILSDMENCYLLALHDTDRKLEAVIAEDKIKFRIPFRRTAVAQLKKKNEGGGGRETVCRLVNNGYSVRPHYRFNYSRSPYVSLKEI